MAAIQQMLLAAGSYTPPSYTYATWNPSDKGGSITFSGGNLTVGVASLATGGCRATLSKSSGKWYWENTFTNAAGPRLGGANSTWNPASAVGGDTNSVGYFPSNGNVYNNSSVYATLLTATTSDVIGIGLDLDSLTINFYKNGLFMTGGSISIPSGTYYPAVSLGSTGSAYSVTANFGATALAFSPPAGFNAGLYV